MTAEERQGTLPFIGNWVADFQVKIIPVLIMTQEHACLAGRHSTACDLDNLSAYDAVLIATDHDGLDYPSLARTARLVIDTRNACASSGADLERVVLA